jgi:hypothetical protein
MSTLENVEEVIERHRPHTIEVRVSYLPATHPFEKDFPPPTTLETVRTDAMAFFQVHDRQERDKYQYFLEFDGARIVNTSQTLAEFTAEHHHSHELHFHLVEEITPG